METKRVVRTVEEPEVEEDAFEKKEWSVAAVEDGLIVVVGAKDVRGGGELICVHSGGHAAARALLR